jgi:predicted extracellular nuclease
MRFLSILIASSMAISGLTACDKDSGSTSQKSIQIDTQGRFEGSNLAGNLMATALKETTQADIVFYPSEFLVAEQFASIEGDLTDEVIDRDILPLYQTSLQKDQFQIGTLRGSEIRDFVLHRTLENYRIDLQTAGLEYDIQFIGGLPTIYQINLAHNQPLVDNQYYRVVISDFEYSNFPGYKYRNSFEQRFRPEPRLISATDSLKKFLGNFKSLPLLNEPRAAIRTRTRGIYPTALTIEQIQGISHLSPYYGYQVITRGIITGISKPEEEEGMEVFIQMPDGTGDNDPRTSRALNVALATKRSDLAPGQEIEVAGMVTEVMTFQGMTRTSIRNVDVLRIIDKNAQIPAFQLLADGSVIDGRQTLKVPNRYVSTYIGNLNQKTSLNLDEGIDFWESIEGMRVEIIKPTVLGFRGGNSKLDEVRRSYISVYVKPSNVSDPSLSTTYEGLTSDVTKNLFNPEVVRIVDSNLSPKVDTGITFAAGQRFEYNLQGIIGFQTNVFGDGEFVLYVTEEFGPAQGGLGRPRKPSTLVPDEEHLTVAAFNVENLPGNRPVRLEAVADSFSTYLNCPDIMILPEIQDFNGPDMEGGSSAEATLVNLMGYMKCADKAYYRALNIDPVPMQDGGEPGGNIRVAMLFNSRRVQFEKKGAATALDETTIDDKGRLNQNPGRLFPNDDVFTHSRKPLVAEFTFRGQRVVVIGNHLNSKLGDGNLWGAQQPLTFDSETSRSAIAKRVNQFATRLIEKDPTAHLIIAGDMNAYWNEGSLKILAGSHFQNLMTYPGLLDSTDWFTTNFNGSTGAIDHMFVSKNLLAREPQYEIVHINSVYMNHLSDHDPILARFKF